MATDSPVYNRLQSVVYRLPFMYNLWATATATDRNSGQPDRKSGCLWSIFRSGPVQFPVYMTGLSNTRSESDSDSELDPIGGEGCLILLRANGNANSSELEAKTLR